MISSYGNSINNLEPATEKQLISEAAAVTETTMDNQQGLSAAEEELLNIIGNSKAIKQARFLVGIHSRYDAPVLVTGETGTGKELAARGLHYCGSRHAKPFVPVNCATLTDELFASEIFGHVKGSFTDAKKDKKGLLAMAEKGTLFLDEIDSLSLKSQAALLRFLQENEYRPVGSETNYRADVRLIASANCDLEERISRGEFRADLYYRLYILSVHMPPLRERHGDVAILVEHFIQQFDYQYNLGIKKVSPNLLRVLDEQEWPGNVRELENLMHRLYLCSRGDVIDTDMLGYAAAEFTQYEKATPISNNSVPKDLIEENINHSVSYQSEDGSYNFSKDKKIAVERFEKEYVEQVMCTAKGNVTLAAKLCGKERRAFGKLVKKYNVKKTSLEVEA